MCSACSASSPDPFADRGLSRRGLLALVGGLAVSGVALAQQLPAGSRVRAVADSAQLAGTNPPTIASCADWNAREPSQPVKMLSKPPVRILVHHTATANKNEVAESDLKVLARAIQDFHMDTNGWIDSGHHFLINRGGLIAEGRHRSLEVLQGGQQFVEGAHCPNQNQTAIGIENQGSYTEVDPPSAMLSSLRTLCAYACVQYGIDPGQLYGHRDYRDTACPGDRLYALLPWLRNQVGQLLGKGSEWRAVTEPTWPLLRIADQGAVVQAAQHLLRAAGVVGVPADGVFGRATADGVFAFQQLHGLELTGMIGGGSWPLLAVDVRPGQGGEAEQAVRVLVSRTGVARIRTPAVVNRLTWQRLLGTA